MWIVAHCNLLSPIYASFPDSEISLLRNMEIGLSLSDMKEILVYTKLNWIWRDGHHLPVCGYMTEGISRGQHVADM